MPIALSGGEQQRLCIARAIVNRPMMLVADEPTGNLDPATSAGIMTLLSTINANGTTVLMATHDSGIVDTMKRRVIELISGQVVRDERQGGYQTQAIPVQDFSLGEREQVTGAGSGAADAARTSAAPVTAAVPAAATLAAAAAPAPQTASFYVPKQRPASEPPATPPSTASAPPVPPPLVEPGGES
jgi:cell division transport system ATP-binding protein